MAIKLNTAIKTVEPPTNTFRVHRMATATSLTGVSRVNKDGAVAMLNGFVFDKSPELPEVPFVNGFIPSCFASSYPSEVFKSEDITSGILGGDLMKIFCSMAKESIPIEGTVHMERSYPYHVIQGVVYPGNCRPHHIDVLTWYPMPQLFNFDAALSLNFPPFDDNVAFRKERFVVITTTYPIGSSGKFKTFLILSFHLIFGLRW